MCSESRERVDVALRLSEKMNLARFSIQLNYVIVLGFRLHFLPVQVWSDEG